MPPTRHHAQRTARDLHPGRWFPLDPSGFVASRSRSSCISVMKSALTLNVLFLLTDSGQAYFLCSRRTGPIYFAPGRGHFATVDQSAVPAGCASEFRDGCLSSLFTMKNEFMMRNEREWPSKEQQLPSITPRITPQANLPRAVSMPRERFSLLFWVMFLPTENYLT